MPPKDESGRSLLRSFVRTFPPLKIALYINDLICHIFSLIIDAISYLIRNAFRVSLFFAKKIFTPVYELVDSACSRLFQSIPAVKSFKEKRARYKKLDKKHQEPIPYSNQLIKRSITYHASLLLALFLYVFVYFVLVKHHSYTSIAVAFVIMLAYLILMENSHNLRSIMMLCLPIMFTNRGRALVFCSMLTLLSSGPIKGLQHNVKEVHTSLNCCKQYLFVQSDKYVGDRVVNKLVRVEEAVLDLVENIKQFARELKDKFDGIIQLALNTEQFIIDTVRKLKQILNICNQHTGELYANCLQNVNKLSVECRNMFNPFRFNFCRVFSRLKEICGTVKLPDVLCELPRNVVDFFERTIGRKLAEYIKLIEEEFYVDVQVDRQFAYNVTKSKSFGKVTREIKFDVESKFWYVHLIRRIFNLLSLILVVWILSTATFYHMHYLSELHYDNMYLDERLNEIEELRKAGLLKLRLATDSQRELEDDEDQDSQRTTFESMASGARTSSLDQNNNNRSSNSKTLESLSASRVPRTRSLIDEFDPLLESPTVRSVSIYDELQPTVRSQEDLSPLGEKQRSANGEAKGQEAEYLFPLSEAHESKYLKPFGLHMNSTELSKLYWSGLVWLVINGYIMFFLVLDFAFYQLVQFLVETLRDILFTSDLPLVDVETKTRNTLEGNVNVVRYNRTYLHALRKQRFTLTASNASLESVIKAHRADHHATSSSIRDFYDRLMLSFERDIPDDVAILESLEGCLPEPRRPNFDTYKLLLYLALFTLGAVIVEAYALRTRHCIANLYYPRRARQRAVWLYRKMLAEKPKYEEVDIDEELGVPPKVAPMSPAGPKESIASLFTWAPDRDTPGQTKSERRRERRKQMRRQALKIGHKLLSDNIKR